MRLYELLTDRDRNTLKSWTIRDESTRMTILEEVEIGDYTLVLFEMLRSTGMADDWERLGLQIGFARTGNDMLDRNIMNRKIPLDAPPSFDALKSILITVRTWAEKYGPIAAGSENPKKTESYYKILKRFGPKIGLYVQKMRVFAGVRLIISKGKLHRIS